MKIFCGTLLAIAFVTQIQLVTAKNETTKSYSSPVVTNAGGPLNSVFEGLKVAQASPHSPLNGQP